LEGPAACSSRPENVTPSGSVGSVGWLTTTDLTLPYVTDFHIQLTFILKKEAAGSFHLIT
jgi:hypothetical protein